MLTKPVKPGRLRHHVQLQKRTLKPDAMGQPIETWETIAKRYADINALTGREPWYSKEVSPDVTHSVEMRSFVDKDGTKLGPVHRIVWGSRIFNIDNVLNPGEQSKGTLIIALCKEPV